MEWTTPFQYSTILLFLSAIPLLVICARRIYRELFLLFVLRPADYQRLDIKSNRRILGNFRFGDRAEVRDTDKRVLFAGMVVGTLGSRIVIQGHGERYRVPPHYVRMTSHEHPFKIPLKISYAPS